METGERDEVHSKLAQVGVELTGEPQAACDTTHGSRDKMVQVTNCIVGNHYQCLLFKLNINYSLLNPEISLIASKELVRINLQVGVASFSVRKHMSYRASLSSTIHSSAFSTSW